MPDVEIEIGGRPFTVACQEGEEAYLRSAAGMLDREARTLIEAGGRLTQDRMLLMAGLMLADKALSAEEERRALEERLEEEGRLLEELQNRPPPEPERVEVEVLRNVDRPFVPDATVERAAALAGEAEEAAELAERLKARIG
jgi:cell division protein ZapA